MKFGLGQLLSGIFGKDPDENPESPPVSAIEADGENSQSGAGAAHQSRTSTTATPLPPHSNAGGTQTGVAPRRHTHEQNMQNSMQQNMQHGAQQSAGARSPVRAHVVNRSLLEQQAAAGSLNPKTLAPTENPDAAAWLDERGLSIKLPSGWKFMGISEDARSVIFNHSGKFDGVAVTISFNPLPLDFPIEKSVAAYKEDLEDKKSSGQISSWIDYSVAGIQEPIAGILATTGGPKSKEDMYQTNDETLWFLTDGTGRRRLTWFGHRRDGDGGIESIFIHISSSVEAFFDLQILFEAILKSVVIQHGDERAQ